MSIVKEAIKLRREGAEVSEAVQVVLGKKATPTASVQEGEDTRSQTQVWLAPDHDKANRALLNLKKYLPKVSVTLSPNNKPAGGYLLTCKGTFKDNDVASLLSGMGGVFRVDNSSGMDLGR